MALEGGPWQILPAWICVTLWPLSDLLVGCAHRRVTSMIQSAEGCGGFTEASVSVDARACSWAGGIGSRKPGAAAAIGRVAALGPATEASSRPITCFGCGCRGCGGPPVGLWPSTAPTGFRTDDPQPQNHNQARSYSRESMKCNWPPVGSSDP